MQDYCFTPEQANKTLPEIRPIVRRIVELKKKISEPLTTIERNQCIDELGVQIAKLEERKIEIKDMDLGLIDFPAKKFEERVYLCWKLDEPEVLYWHELHSGYRGRRLLKPELLRAR